MNPPTTSARSSVRVLWIGAALAALCCVIGLAWLAIRHRPPRSLILLVSIDTLRADALGSYGNPRPITPHLDRLAADGVRFAHTLAASPWTIPSHASLLTSLDPTVTQASTSHALPPSVLTLAEVLRDAGYTTGAIVNTEYLGRKFGFDQGFDDFQEPILHKGAPQVVDSTLTFLQTHAAERVFFFLHLFDVHGPYDPLQIGDGARGERRTPDADVRQLQRIHYHDYLKLDRFESVPELHAAYEAGVQRVDAELGRLFAVLRERGLYDEALILVTSDHGEAFFEHGIWVGHGLFLYENELRIPLILKLPKGRGPRGAVVETPVSLIDVMPTILEVVGNAPAPSAQGQSLLSFVRAPLADRHVLGYSTNTGYTEVVRSRQWKYIAPMRQALGEVIDIHLRADAIGTRELSRRIITGPQLYDLATDPNEAINVAADHPAIVATMEQLVVEHRQRDARHRERYIPSEARGVIDLSPDERERLRQLGYEH